MTATIPPPTPPKPPATLLILRDGTQYRVGGLSASWAKHVRRTKGELI
jgi:hypothetical protein